MPDLSLGLSSATQGSYVRGQALLDISQGTRVSRSTYSPSEVPLAGPLLTDRMVNGSGRLLSWDRILTRAETAPQTIEPGLLAGSIPDGAAFVGPDRAIRRRRDPGGRSPRQNRCGLRHCLSPENQVAGRASRACRCLGFAREARFDRT